MSRRRLVIEVGPQRGIDDAVHRQRPPALLILLHHRLGGRPELAVVLSMSKIHLKDAAEELKLADDPTMEGELFAAFPQPSRWLSLRNSCSTWS